MVKHQATKVPYNQLLASEWNAEHILTFGTDSGKPSSGLTVGQIYWATDTRRLYRANSSTTWEEILPNIVQEKAAGTSTFSTSSTTWVDVTSISVTINPPYLANILVNASFYSVRNNGGSFYCTSQRLVRDSTAIRVQNITTESANRAVPAIIEKLDMGQSGSHTYKLQGCVDPSGLGTSYWDMNTGEYQGEIFAIAMPS